MPQRLTSQRTVYVQSETTEGTDPGSWAGGHAVLVSNLTVGPSRAHLPRKFSGTFGQRFAAIGIPDDPTLSFTCELKGGGTAVPPEIDALWESVMGTRQADSFTGKTVNGTPAPTNSVFTISPNATSITNPVTSGKPNSIAVEINGAAGKYEIGYIKQIDTDQITLLAPLSFTPAAAANVKPTVTYGLAGSSHKSVAIRIWLEGNDYIQFLGCKGSVKLDVGAPGTVGTATFALKAIRYEFGSASKPAPTYDSTTPPTNSRFRLDAALTDIKAVSWDLAQMVAKKQSQNAQYGTFAQLVTERDLKGSVQLYDVDNLQFSGWDAGTNFAIGHQMGDTLNNIAGYQVLKAQRAKVAYGDDAGLTTDMLDFQGNVTDGNDEAAVAYA